MWLFEALYAQHVFLQCLVFIIFNVKTYLYSVYALCSKWISKWYYFRVYCTMLSNFMFCGYGIFSTIWVFLIFYENGYAIFIAHCIYAQYQFFCSTGKTKQTKILDKEVRTIGKNNFVSF